ncbi:MAG: hypothetical protein ACRD2W_05915 [Acidimicrobiales bacterium]
MPRRVTAVLLLTLAACGGRDEAAETRKVEDAVRRSIEAENAGDVTTFLSLWTDDGLRSYDAGTRNQIESGQAVLGREQTELRAFASTIVKGDQAVATIDGRVELGLYRSRFDLVRRDGRWLLDGFRFLGPTPAAAGATVVEVTAVEYGYGVDPAALSSGDFAVRIVNQGQEQHEISVVSLPAGATKAEAVLALAAANGLDPSTLPAGYGALGHLAYAQPGETTTYTLGRTLAAGRYALVCFLPVGGVNEFGMAHVSGAESHVARGMLADFTVA